MLWICCIIRTYYIAIYIGIAHVLLVNVGLAQARPNNVSYWHEALLLQLRQPKWVETFLQCTSFLHVATNFTGYL